MQFKLICTFSYSYCILSFQVFEKGIKVLKKNNRRDDRKGGKAEDSWLGPYIVEEVKQNGTYKISRDGRVLKTLVNASQLKLYIE